MAEDLSQNIQAFLETLKLADKYSDLFIHNGYMTVGDCDGMTEETLKSIGITLTGLLVQFIASYYLIEHNGVLAFLSAALSLFICLNVVLAA